MGYREDMIRRGGDIRRQWGTDPDRLREVFRAGHFSADELRVALGGEPPGATDVRLSVAERQRQDDIAREQQGGQRIRDDTGNIIPRAPATGAPGAAGAELTDEAFNSWVATLPANRQADAKDPVKGAAMKQWRSENPDAVGLGSDAGSYDAWYGSDAGKAARTAAGEAPPVRMTMAQHRALADEMNVTTNEAARQTAALGYLVLPVKNAETGEWTYEPFTNEAGETVSTLEGQMSEEQIKSIASQTAMAEIATTGYATDAEGNRVATPNTLRILAETKLTEENAIYTAGVKTKLGEAQVRAQDAQTNYQNLEAKLREAQSTGSYTDPDTGEVIPLATIENQLAQADLELKNAGVTKIEVETSGIAARTNLTAAETRSRD